MKLTKGRNKFGFVLVALVILASSCSPKITGTWYYKKVTAKDTVPMPIGYGDALNLHKFEVQVFDYHMRLADRSATGHWTMNRCGTGKCLNLTYHPSMQTQTFKIERLTKTKLRISEGGLVFTFSRYPD